MWGWLKPLWDGLAAAVKGALQAILPFLWKKAEQPSTITDEQIPDTMRDALDADLAAKLRDKQSSDSTQGSGPAGE